MATRSPVARDDRLGRDRGVVEEAVAAVHRAGRVMAGRPAQPVRRGGAAQHEIRRRQRDIHGGARGDVRAGDQRRRGIEAPEASPSRSVDGLADESRDRLGRHPFEHRAVRVGVGGQVRPVDALRTVLGPGDLEEAHETRVVDRGDRVDAVLRRPDDREPTVRLECHPDPLGALGDLVGRDRRPHVGLDRDVVAQVGRRIDDLHPIPVR